MLNFLVHEEKLIENVNDKAKIINAEAGNTSKCISN